MYDETVRQSADDGTPFAEVLASKGVIPGIKVDTGAQDQAGFPGEKVTEGLDGLRARLEEYRELGARFAKWRATYTIADELPSQLAYDANAHALARYAALCQEAGIVPIVEPEVLMDGDHTIERSEVVTSAALQALYDQLSEQRIFLEGTILKPNMVLTGYDAKKQAQDAEIAERTIATFRRHVPSAVPGIMFLSGGQSDEQATARLNEMNKRGPHPWQLSFSYGRALQAPSLKAWKGEASNVGAAQAAFAHRARLNGVARSGKYTEAMENAA
jgi:fructose-bisphosphate aldolase class I